VRRGFRVVLAGLVLGALCALPAGCGLGGAGQITLGYLGWDENVANSTLVKVLLEDNFGYENVELRLADRGVGEAFRFVAEDEADVFMDAWMPNHRRYVDEHRGEMDLYRKPWYDGATEFGIAVPHYMEGIETIADLRSAEPGMITGIEPGAVLMPKITNSAVPKYDLDFSVVEAPTPAMLVELREAYSVEEPFVFVAWSPHWMNQEYDFRYLEDPKNALGTADDPQTLHTVARKGFAEDEPIAHALISAMRLNETQVGSMEIFINQAVEGGEEPEAGVRAWLEESENRTAVEPWLEAARRAEAE
jgi:glycine betaine/proline transport system substrate-binding protein